MIISQPSTKAVAFFQDKATSWISILDVVELGVSACVEIVTRAEKEHMSFRERIAIFTRVCLFRPLQIPEKNKGQIVVWNSTAENWQ